MSGVKRSFDSQMKDVGRMLGTMMRKQAMDGISLVQGEVIAVGDGTADVQLNDGHVLSEVNLNIISGGNSSVLMTPVVGSLVIVGFVENRPELAYISSFTNVDKILIQSTIGDVENSVEITNRYVEIKRGESTCKIEDKIVSLDSGESSLRLSGKAALNTLADVLSGLVDLASTDPYTLITAPPTGGPCTVTPNPSIASQKSTLQNNINANFE